MTFDEQMAWLARGLELMLEYPMGSPWFERGIEIALGDL
jgi:hypothetical protein